MKNRRLIVLVALLPLTMTSCVCVHAVREAGVHRRSLAPRATWIDPAGEKAVECDLSEQVSARARRHSLGTRFVRASPSTWSNAVAHGYALRSMYNFTQHIDKVVVNIGLPPVTNMAGEGFRLSPPDLRTVQTGRLPEGWQQVSRQEYAPYFMLEYSNHVETVAIQYVTLAEQDATCKRWWWLPAQVLLPAALVVDIVTFPLQAAVVVHAFNEPFR